MMVGASAMDRFKLSYLVAVVVLCVAVARGLDRLIVDPVQAPQAPTPSRIVTTRPPPATLPEPPAPAYPTASPEQRIPVASDGHYYVDAAINGWPVQHMLIDTGATYLALSYEDAASLGIYPGPAEYKYETRTANGTAHVAAVTLREVRLGSLVVENVQAVIGERGMLDVSLLGMSFLSHLSRVETADGALILRR
jgi:aspartyl protease family protein